MDVKVTLNIRKSALSQFYGKKKYYIAATWVKYLGKFRKCNLK